MTDNESVIFPCTYSTVIDAYASALPMKRVTQAGRQDERGGIMETQQMYPLTTAQHLNFMSWRFSFLKQIMNIPSSFFVDEPLDLMLLKKAAEEAVSRNDSFGMRVTKQGKEVMQYFTDRRVLCIEMKDFSGQKQETMEAFFYKTARTPFPLYDRPLAKIYIIRTPDGNAGLFTCICHLMMDAYALNMFYRDVVSVYMALRDNTPMPAPVRSCESVIQKELEYLSSDRHKADLNFWKQEMLSLGKSPVYTHVNGPAALEKYRRFIRKPDYPFAINVHLRATAKHEILLVEKQDVESMKDFCCKHNLSTMQMLFYVGLRTYLARVNNRTADVTVADVVARRGTLEEKLSGGSRPLALFCRTVIEENTSFEDALDHLMEKQNTLYRHANASTMQVIQMMYDLYGMKPYEGYCTMYLTFQPVPMDVGHNLKVRSEWYCNGTAAMSTYVTVMDDNSSGALRCYYEYLDKFIKAETIQSCHNYMLKVIRTGIADPSVTMKELLDLPM